MPVWRSLYQLYSKGSTEGAPKEKGVKSQRLNPLDFVGAPGGIRTPDLRIRSLQTGTISSICPVLPFSIIP
jgi:hypothetical protein